MAQPWVLLAAPLLAAAAFTDLGWRIVPNWVSIALVLSCAGVMLVGRDPVGLLLALAAGGGVLIGGAALFAAGLLGGGDVKLAAATTVWIGAEALPEFLAVTALAGGLLALGILAGRALRRCVGRRRSAMAAPTVPYGVAIAAGALWTLAGQP
jgi:prepilin peptidase CpaA